MDKFGRTYQLKIQVDDNGTTLLVTLPFTIELDITRNTLTSANVCQLRIYNLSEKNRNLIRFNVSDYGTFRAIQLLAGYGTNLKEIFSGNISQAWSVREGTDFITQIECYDGGFAFNNAKTSMQFPENTAQTTVFRSLASQLPHVKVGAIGNFTESLTRGGAYVANPNTLGEISGGAFFIDRGRANFLKTNEVISSPEILVINAKSGLLGTPVLEQTICRFDMLFEPSLNVGYRIRLMSATGSNFNGFYKVTAVKHRGMISESVSGSVITTGEFFFSKILTPVSGGA